MNGHLLKSGKKFGLALLLALASAGAGAQNAVTITGYQDSDSVSALRFVPGRAERQSLTATFLIQGDNLPLSNLTVSGDTSLEGSKDTAWLQSSDAGMQARLLLNTTFSAQIEGAPAQGDAAGALQSLINAAAAQGYTTVPTGSYIKFIHSMDISSLPVMQKNTVQIVDRYTLQDAAQGLGSSADGRGILRGKASAPATPASAIPTQVTPTQVTPTRATPVKPPVKKPVTVPAKPSK